MSGGTRRRRANAVIREIVAEAVRTGLSDPRLASVTITNVSATPDLREATVGYTTLADEDRDAAGEGLRAARGVLQGKIGEALQARNTPQLRFVLDEHHERAEALTRLIDELSPPEEA